MEPSKMKSFEDYYKLYYEQVKKFILKRVGDEQVAEDLTSDVFTSCLDSFDRFDPEKASFRTWLFVITKNRLKNYFRDRKIFDELSDECAVYERFEDEIVQAQYLSMLRDDIATALLTLPLVQKEIVKRRYFMNQNSFEIAEILGISPVNVRVQLSRALVKLREYLEESGVDPRDL
ncbi:MAG: sigma-70 family RNA polymerase sigma factor [Lachnospiraceae bacterium]|nr:sigma-70 family RNA polymerase sigma factor [Lachnospiraceae bacterium]